MLKGIQTAGEAVARKLGEKAGDWLGHVGGAL